MVRPANDNGPPVATYDNFMEEEALSCECGSLRFFVIRREGLHYITCVTCGCDVTRQAFGDI